MTNKIRELRTAQKISQGDLAQQLNVSRAALSGYETGKYEAELRTYIQIADLFGVSLDYLLDHAAPEAAPLDQQQTKLLDLFSQLNAEGQEKLLEYAEDLVASGRYIKTDQHPMVSEA